MSSFVYILGYPHNIFGHVVKVGVSDNVGSRMAAIQSHNPDEVIHYFSFEFPTRQMAFGVEGEFHHRFSHCGIRGEWFGMDDRRALYLLSLEIVDFLSRRFQGDELRAIRKSCGLHKAFALLDDASDEEQNKWNIEWHDSTEANYV